MSDIALDLDPQSSTFRDLVIENGDLQIVDGTEGIKQDILQSLRVFLGEWFLNLDVGLPYFQQILVKNPDQGKVDALILATILAVPGVTGVTKFSFTPNFVERTLRIEFIASVTNGIVDYAGLL